jgi:uncharacterized protein (UPF0303 family)
MGVDRETQLEFLAALLEQERTVQFESFGYADAWAVGSELVRLGMEQELPISMAIMLGDQRVFHAALAGTSADNDDWLERKFRVVRRFGHSSLAIGTEYKSRGKLFDKDSNLSVATFAAHGGAFPILVRGSIVGVAGVSGLAQRDDHDLVVDALTSHRDRSPAASAS